MKIKLLLASPRGYCAGVTRAIEIVDQAIGQYGTPLYINHEIIHNKFIIEHFIKKGVIFGEDVGKIPEGSIIIFSAHGIGPEFVAKVKKQKLKYIDASCPLVIKVHTEARSFLTKGYDIIYIGKKGHQEAEGILEEGRDNIHIVSSLDDLEELYRKYDSVDKIGLLTQTTLGIDETTKIIEKAKSLYPKIELPKSEDICYATTNRQNAVKEIVKDSDLLVIVGSKNSSNSSKLQNIGLKNSVPSILVDSYTEIDTELLNGLLSTDGDITIGLSGGASAPEHLIEEVIIFLEGLGEVNIKKINTIEEKMVFPSKLILQS